MELKIYMKRGYIYICVALFHSGHGVNILESFFIVHISTFNILSFNKSTLTVRSYVTLHDSLASHVLRFGTLEHMWVGLFSSKEPT